MVAEARATGSAEAHAQGVVGQQRVEVGRQRRDVAHGIEGARRPGHHEVGGAADVGRDDRQPARHVLEHRVRQALGLGAQHADGGLVEEVDRAALRVVDRHAVRHAEPRRRRAHVVVRPAADEQRVDARVAAREPRDRLHEVALPLEGLQVRQQHHHDRVLGDPVRGAHPRAPQPVEPLERVAVVHHRDVGRRDLLDLDHVPLHGRRIGEVAVDEPPGAPQERHGRRRVPEAEVAP